MILYILRHADAEERRPGLKDDDRALTRRGRKQAEAVARLFKSAGHPADTPPDRLLTSAAVRARQTSTPLEESLALKAEIEPRIGLRAGDEDALELVSEIAGSGEVCILVGHNPTLEDLIARLGGEARLKKGQLVALDVKRAGRALRARELGRFRSDD